MKCPNEKCMEELRAEDFPVIRLHPDGSGEMIVKCQMCLTELTAVQKIVWVPTGIYRRAEDQLKKVGG